MSYDDPFKSIREMSLQFERLNELVRSPFHELNEAVRWQHELHSLSADRLAGFLDGVTTFRSLAQEAGDRLRSVMEEQSAAVSSLSSWADEVAVGTRWMQQEAFYEASIRGWLNTLPPVLEDTAIKASLNALALSDGSGLESVKRFQEILQSEILKIETLSESIPALKFEEQLGLLATKLEEPQIASELLSFRESFEGFRRMGIVSNELLNSMRSLADSIDLPHLGDAVLQWAETLQSLSAESLGSARLFSATFSALSGVLTELPVVDPGHVVEEWQRLVAEEAERHSGRELPNWLQGFLINLLFFLLSLVYSTRSSKENTGRLDELEAGQSAIIEAVEGKSEETQNRQASQELELAAIRQALEELAETVIETESSSRPDLRIALAALRLRSEPSTDSDVLLVIPKGFPAEIVEELEGWCRVHVMDFASGQVAKGWVAKEYLREWDELDD